MSFPRATTLLLFVIGLAACSKNELVLSPVEPGSPFSIDAADFARNYYFVDTSYVTEFPQLFSRDSSVGVPDNPITNVEVWMSRLGTVPDPNELSGRAIINLSSYARPYPTSLRIGSDTVGEAENQRFVRLRSESYTLPLSGRAGLIAVRIPVPDHAVIAVSYRNDTGGSGETLLDFPPDSLLTGRPILFQMIKPRNLFSIRAGYPIAWRLVLKSVYSTGLRNVDRQNFVLDVSYRDRSRTTAHQIFGHSLLFLLGLDHLDRRGNVSPQGDGEFDFVPGITIDREYGEIIMPLVNPFSDGLRESLHAVAIDVSPSDPAFLPAIYDSIPFLTTGNYRGVYTISGRAIGF